MVLLYQCEHFAIRKGSTYFAGHTCGQHIIKPYTSNGHINVTPPLRGNVTKNFVGHFHIQHLYINKREVLRYGL